MIFTRTGEVVPGFHALGSRHTPVCLLDAPRPALFDAGLAFLGELYTEDVRRVLGRRSPELLLLTHAHFDHCGAAGALRQAFPGLRVGASAEAADILSRPRALEHIRALNEDAVGLGPAIGAPEPSRVPFRPFEVELILRDGDEVDLGDDVSLRVLGTPGHTRDLLSYYEPRKKILVASEAAGCPDRFGNIHPEFGSSYEAYAASLRRLCELEVEVLCPGHEQIYVGADAGEFLRRSLRETEKYRAWVEGLLEEEERDLERVVARIKAVQWDPVPQPKQPLPAYLTSTRARVRLLAKRSDRTDGVDSSDRSGPAA